MKNMSKAASLILCASFMMSICSCEAMQRQPKETEDLTKPVVDLADDLGRYIVNLDYGSIRNMSTEGDEDLETIMNDLEYTGNYNEGARKEISKTLECKTLEDTAEVSEEGDEASIDVQFDYVDYEKLISDDVLYVGMTPFTDALAACTDRIEVTLTFEFEKDENGKMLLTNIGVIKDLFPYASADFNFAESLDSYIGELTFSGERYDNLERTYRDTTYIDCAAQVLGDGQSLTWDYRLKVEVGGEVIYESDLISESNPIYIGESYPDADDITDEILPDGEYTVSLETEGGLVLASGTVTVTHTEEAEPVNYEYYCPEGNSTILPGTSYNVTLDDGLEFRDADYETVQGIMENGNPNHIVVHADDGPYGDEGFSAQYIPDAHSVDDPAAQAVLQENVDHTIEWLDDEFPNRIIETRDVTIGDQTFQITMIDQGESAQGLNWAWGYMLIEQNGVVYLIYIDGCNIDDIMLKTGMITVVESDPRI